VASKPGHGRAGGTLGNILRQGRTREAQVVSEYVVIYERSDTGWGAYCPDLPARGRRRTREEVDRLIREAVVVHIQSLREHGDPVPEPTTSAGTVEVPAA
jgi:predicted RNase H-like HicB family nuclease